MKKLIGILNDAGFKTVSGYHYITKELESRKKSGEYPLCSGYRVFPDGSKCDGCKDCQKTKCKNQS